MPVPSNWCSLIEIMSYHCLWPSSRRNIYEIHRSAIYFLHSFGILIFISRGFRIVVIIRWSTESCSRGGIKESRKYSAQNTKLLSLFSLLIHSHDRADDYAVLQRIISDRSFRFFYHCELFIAASRINYLFCARNFKRKTNSGKNSRVHLGIPTIYFDSRVTRDKFTSWNSRVNLKKKCNSYRLATLTIDCTKRFDRNALGCLASRNSEKYIIITNNNM